MQCEQCGRKNPEWVTECTNCGRPLRNVHENATIILPANGQWRLAVGRFSLTRTMVLTGAVVVLALILIVLISVIPGANGARKVADDYMDAFMRGDGYGIVDLMHPTLVSNENYSHEDIIHDLTRAGLGTYFTKCEYLSAQKMYDLELNTIKEYFKSAGVGAPVEECQVIKYRVHIEYAEYGANYEEEISKDAIMAVYVFKINGRWYLGGGSVVG